MPRQKRNETKDESPVTVPEWEDAVKDIAPEVGVSDAVISSSEGDDGQVPTHAQEHTPRDVYASLAGVVAYEDQNGQEVQPAAEQAVVPSNILKVNDAEGHLLFCYNAATRNIEIVRHGRKFLMSADTLRNAAARNFISETLQEEFVAKDA